jgi:hypothetical protein
MAILRKHTTKTTLLKGREVVGFVGLFGERGGTRTHDPMIKSHVPVKQL